MSDGLRVERDGHLLTLTLDRPPGNRVSRALIARLYEALTSPATSDDARVVLLTHTGPDFSQGADLRDPMLARAMAGGVEGRRAVAEEGARLVKAWRDLRVPTVVAASGDILGAGACLFSAADLRFASVDAALRFPEVDRGMHLSWGILPELVQTLGVSWTKRLVLGGEICPGDAFPSGFARFGVGPDETREMAVSEARRLCQKAPLAVKSVKAALREIAEGDLHVAERDADRFVETTGSKDFLEAVQAFLEKRPPTFTGE